MASLHLFKLGHTQVLISCIQTDFTGTCYLITSFSHVRTKPSGQGCVSNCAPKQWNSLPSEIHHIQSSCALKNALKTHLYKQYPKWFQNYVCLLASPSYPPSPLITFLLRIHVCVRAQEEYNDYIIYYFCGFNICFCWSCKAQCDHPCW